MIRFLGPADYTSMRWKNGGGRTTEIAVYPPASTLDTFHWRVSLADVASDGPFSRFPGVDRILVLLDGTGMRLNGGGRETELRTRFEPYRFRGDDAIDCTLIAGPVRDFNAMFRRGAARGDVTVVSGKVAEIPPSDFLLVYAATGMHECRIAGHPSHALGAGQAVLVEKAVDAELSMIAVSPSRPDAIALVVSIDLA